MIFNVTPYVGVWIETPVERIAKLSTTVTPYVGVWIETLKVSKSMNKYLVTPYVGVWIETMLGLPYEHKRGSLLMWECGLKQLRCDVRSRL